MEEYNKRVQSDMQKLRKDLKDVNQKRKLESRHFEPHVNNLLNSMYQQQFLE